MHHVRQVESWHSWCHDTAGAMTLLVSWHSWCHDTTVMTQLVPWHSWCHDTARAMTQYHGSSSLSWHWLMRCARCGCWRCRMMNSLKSAAHMRLHKNSCSVITVLTITHYWSFKSATHMRLHRNNWSVLAFALTLTQTLLFPMNSLTITLRSEGLCAAYIKVLQGCY